MFFNILILTLICSFLSFFFKIFKSTSFYSFSVNYSYGTSSFYFSSSSSFYSIICCFLTILIKVKWVDGFYLYVIVSSLNFLNILMLIFLISCFSYSEAILYFPYFSEAPQSTKIFSITPSKPKSFICCSKINSSLAKKLQTANQCSDSELI